MNLEKPPGTHLSLVGRTIIQTMRKCGATIRYIAQKLHRNKKTICSILKKAEIYGRTKISRRSPKVDERSKWQKKRLAFNKNVSPAKIRQQLNLEVSARRVQQILKEYKNIQNIKRGAST